MQETAEQYRKRMYGYIEGQNPLKLEAAAPAKLAKLLKGVSAATARKRPAPDKWSIAEIVAHISDTELVSGYRIRAILGQPGTQIIGFDQDGWVTALHYDRRDLKKSYEQYRALREANLALLKSLKPEQWKHEGMHNERGRESVETILRMMAGHDLNHFGQIERILAAKKAKKKK
jgi:DinB superfamily